jgi:hypothetical protein
VKKQDESFKDEECTECDAPAPRFKLALCVASGDVVDYVYLCDECAKKIVRDTHLGLALDLSRCKLPWQPGRIGS